jgi:hypothetical protein
MLSKAGISSHPHPKCFLNTKLVRPLCPTEIPTLSLMDLS